MTLPTFSLRLPWVPTASKNRQRIVHYGQRAAVRMSKAAEEDKARIEGLAFEQLVAMGARANYLAGRQLHFRMVWDPWKSEVWCFVEDRGELVRLPGPRRDISNMDAVVLDALQGVVYPDDHAVRSVHLLTQEQPS